MTPYSDYRGLDAANFDPVLMNGADHVGQVAFTHPRPPELPGLETVHRLREVEKTSGVKPQKFIETGSAGSATTPRRPP